MKVCNTEVFFPASLQEECVWSRSGTGSYIRAHLSCCIFPLQAQWEVSGLTLQVCVTFCCFIYKCFRAESPLIYFILLILKWSGIRKQPVTLTCDRVNLSRRPEVEHHASSDLLEALTFTEVYFQVFNIIFLPSVYPCHRGISPSRDMQTSSLATYSRYSGGTQRRSQARRDILSPACCGSAPGPPHGRTCCKHII